MADWQNMQLQGFEQLKRNLAALPTNIGKNVLRGMVNAGAKVVQDEAARLAPVYAGPDPRAEPGRLRRALYRKQIREMSSVIKQTFYVGVRMGKKNQKIKVGRGKGAREINLDAWYGVLVEFGTSKMAAKPFMRPAFDAKRQAAIDAMKAYAEKRIPKEVEKLRK